MALDPKYFVTSDLESYFVNKDTGLPLANGTISFFRDAARTVPKEVFYLTGAPPYNSSSYVSLGAVVTLSAVGTVQNSGGDNEIIYYYPWVIDPTDPDGPLLLDLYYISVKDSGGTEQFTREAWPNLTIEDTPEVGAENFITNQISNPTFTNVFLNEGITTTYTVTVATDQEFEFAPDWDFVISGTGTVIVQRLAITGSQQIVTNPPYVIDMVISSGITKCHLRQRLPKNSGLWTSTTNRPVFLYGSFIAQNQVVGSAGIQMFYQESSGINNTTPILIVAGSFTSPYALQTGATVSAIPPSTNTNSGEAGYVDIYLQFDTPSQVRFSSVQVIPSAISPVNQILPDFDSSNRNEAFQADYYIPRAAAKQIDSYLTGWDFPVNPYQFGASGPLTVLATYIVDQTIAAHSGSVAWSKDPVTNGLKFTSADASGAFFIQQYLTGTQVKKMIGSRLSVNAFAYQSTAGTASTMRIHLYRAKSGAAIIPVLPTNIGTLSPDGSFTLTAGNQWALISRSGLSIPQTTLNIASTPDSINSPNNDHGFSGWELTGTEINNTDLFAIVATFTYAATACDIVINSISVVPGDLPCRPAVKSLQATALECQYYYEKSYNLDVVAPTVTDVGAVVSEQSYMITTTSDPLNYTYNYFARNMYVNYKALKRLAVTPKIYFGNIQGNLLLNIYNGNANTLDVNTPVLLTNWTFTQLGDSGFVLKPVDLRTVLGTFTFGIGPARPLSVETIVYFHYVADARLGIV